MTWREGPPLSGALDGPRERAARALGPAVTRLLREEHAPPGDPRYWGRLEARIMDGIRRGSTHHRAAAGWSAAFAAWARTGLAAASIAAAAAGLAAWNTNRTESRIVYETVVDVAATVPIQADTRLTNVSEQEATDRYVFSH